MYYNVKIENRREGFTIMDAFTEFLGELTGKLSGFEDIIAASALILIDVCALVIIAFCSKGKKSGAAAMEQSRQTYDTNRYGRRFHIHTEFTGNTYGKAYFR